MSLASSCGSGRALTSGYIKVTGTTVTLPSPGSAACASSGPAADTAAFTGSSGAPTRNAIGVGAVSAASPLEAQAELTGHGKGTVVPVILLAPLVKALPDPKD